MKSLALVVLFVLTSQSSANFFHLKPDHVTIYSMVIKAWSPDKSLYHSADFHLHEIEEGVFRCKLKNVKIDEQMEDFDRVDIWEFTREDMVFKFNSDGLLQFIKPDDLEEPRTIVYDERLVKAIRDGKRTFTKRMFVPFTDKRCKGDVVVEEQEDSFEVSIEVENDCLDHPIVDTKISLKSSYFRDSMTLKTYEIFNDMVFEKPGEERVLNTKLHIAFEFAGFEALGEDTRGKEKETKEEL